MPILRKRLIYPSGLSPKALGCRPGVSAREAVQSPALSHGYDLKTPRIIDFHNYIESSASPPILAEAGQWADQGLRSVIQTTKPHRGMNSKAPLVETITTRRRLMATQLSPRYLRGRSVLKSPADIPPGRPKCARGSRHHRHALSSAGPPRHQAEQVSICGLSLLIELRRRAECHTTTKFSQRPAERAGRLRD